MWRMRLERELLWLVSFGVQSSFLEKSLDVGRGRPIGGHLLHTLLIFRARGGGQHLLIYLAGRIDSVEAQSRRRFGRVRRFDSQLVLEQRRILFLFRRRWRVFLRVILLP